MHCGRYFQRSDISKDPVLNCKDREHPHPHHDVPTIEDRAVQSLHRKRNQWGAPFHKSTLDREAAVHNRHGRLKVVKDIPNNTTVMGYPAVPLKEFLKKGNNNE